MADDDDTMQEAGLPRGHSDDPAAAGTAATGTKQYVDIGTKYRSYVTFYSNLDNLVWKNVSLGLTVTALAGGLLTQLLPHSELTLPTLTHNITSAVLFLLLSVFYLMISFTIWRMRYHFERMELHIRDMEEHGYFHDRKSSVKDRWMSDIHWMMGLFLSLCVSCFSVSAYYFYSESDAFHSYKRAPDEAYFRLTKYESHVWISGLGKSNCMETNGGLGILPLHGFAENIAPCIEELEMREHIVTMRVPAHSPKKAQGAIRRWLAQVAK